MMALKHTLFFILFTFTIASLSSCLLSIGDSSQCGKDKLLGTLQLADSTKNLYSNWTGKEVLFFKDSLGNELEYFSERGKTILFKLPVVTKTLCDVNWLDQQTEYFNSEAHYLDFVPRNNAKRSLHIQLYTTTITKNSTFIIFDLFSANFYGTIELAIARDKTSANDLHNQFMSNAQFIADTTIFGKNFKNVFYMTDEKYNIAIYFQKTNMVIGFKDGTKTWILDRIK
jgi:hypothetical protein